MMSLNPFPGLGSVEHFMPPEDPPHPRLAPQKGQDLQQVLCNVSQLCADILGISGKMALAAPWVTDAGPLSTLQFLPLFWDGTGSKTPLLSAAARGK